MSHDFLLDLSLAQLPFWKLKAQNNIERVYHFWDLLEEYGGGDGSQCSMVSCRNMNAV